MGVDIRADDCRNLQFSLGGICRTHVCIHLYHVIFAVLAFNSRFFDIRGLLEVAKSSQGFFRSAGVISVLCTHAFAHFGLWLVQNREAQVQTE